jgi:2-amino-4-hydroxy-6-hydroxymethyldihydropteridine diphosphokinase
MVFAYLALGSNLGDRRANIERALSGIRKTKKTEILKVSDIIETEPVGGPPQGKYLNGVLKVRTDLPARELLYKVKSIEKEMGREKAERNAPRIIDIDILLYDNRKFDEQGLKIPHPRMWGREFVMRPLSQLMTDGEYRSLKSRDYAK